MKKSTRKPRKQPSEEQTTLVYSTTLGRAKFPEFIQMSYGEKAIIGFDRYGRLLGAIVPMEAVKILAGREAELNHLVREQIAHAAAELLSQSPQPLSVDAFASGAAKQKAPRTIMERAEIAARRERRAARKTAKTRRPAP
ncbi:MAG: hypothetical protein NW200_06695 [Hyphomonadaceae bacterium]|nr:hypothetical protein [Hyphomonadaceae bacterium]